MRLLVIVWLALALASCGAGRAGQGVAPAPTAAPAPPSTGILFAAPARESPTYGTRSSPDGIRGEQDAWRAAESLSRAAAARGLALQPDGRLADLAAWVASLVDARGKAPPSGVFDFGARHLGIAEDTPMVVTLAGGSAEERDQYVARALASTPANIGYNRFGVVSIVRDGLPICVVVIAVSMIDLEPVPRALRVGSVLRLRGRLEASFRKHAVVVTQPDGTAKEIAERDGVEVDAPIALPAPGAYRVEVLGSGPWGLTVVANFPVYAGVEPPRTVRIEPRAPSGTASPVTTESAHARLLELLNASRRDAGLAPVQTHEGLARIADAHTRDMAANGFFGHVSPTTGDPSSRVRAAGLKFAIVAENVGIGQSPEEVHRALLESPGHRANVLNTKLTHVGIGVALKDHEGRRDVIATELFARIAPPIDVAKAPSELLAKLNAARGRTGSTPLVMESALSDAASRGATLWLHDASLDKNAVLDAVVTDMDKQAKGGHPAWQKIGKAESFITIVSSLDDALTFESAVDPAARFVGIGVVQGRRGGEPDNAIAVVMIVGWPRK